MHTLLRIISASLFLTATSRAEPAVKDLPPATPEAISAAITRGVDFLIADQNANGSWGSATRTKGLNIYAPLPGAHDAFRAGASGLAFSGLLDSADTRPEAAAAIEKATAWSIEHLPKLRRADQTTTYNIWGHAYGLRALTRLWLRETDPEKKALYRKLAQQQVQLVARYEDVNGGWGYLDLFDDITTQEPTGITTSFSSATVLLAMHESRESMGVTLDEKIVTSSLDSIKRQQFPDKSYGYSHSHIMRPRADINRPAGSLSRSQACNAALRAYGREGITDEVITEWADRFLAREGFLSIARKRPRPHDIHFRISGYFYYYGVYYFTESVSFLPPEKRKPYAERLAALIISRQEKDGSWWDYPLYDYHQPYGTGYCLMALKWCRDEMAAD
ncbi:hypothetical protein HZ994_07650 [Akkermansiaceae bacterium]|nr:hypothetical protein HZ994_07650 [Akkermansiaceae bacterium]